MAAYDEEERRVDTVALPRSTFKAGAWILTGCLSAGAVFVWDIGSKVDAVKSVSDVMALRIKYLEDFGPVSGERFTKRDGRDLEDEIEAIRQWMLEIQKSMNEHHAKGEHSFAGRRLDGIELWIRDHEKRLKQTGKIRNESSP